MSDQVAKLMALVEEVREESLTTLKNKVALATGDEELAEDMSDYFFGATPATKIYVKRILSNLEKNRGNL